MNFPLKRGSSLAYLYTTHAIFSVLEYDERIEKLVIPMMNDFLHDLCAKHYSRIASDPCHPLSKRINFNQCRTSSIYRPLKANKQNRAKSFFNFCRTHFNKRWENQIEVLQVKEVNLT